MERDIDRILIPQQRIAQRVAEVARLIVADHTPPNVPDEGEIAIVPIMTGAMIFCADLIRHMPIALRIGLLTVSSYPGKPVSSQGAQLISKDFGNLAGRHVVVVDDILDSGTTLRFVRNLLSEVGAASVRTCVLLRKLRDGVDPKLADYVGFEIPDEFVVGYGLDFNDYYRNLPDIVTLKKELIGGAA